MEFSVQNLGVEFLITTNSLLLKLKKKPNDLLRWANNVDHLPTFNLK
jgi:hypothetical protein